MFKSCILMVALMIFEALGFESLSSLSQPEALKALQYLRIGDSIQVFCPTCGETSAKTLRIVSVESIPSPTQPGDLMLQINGLPVEAAHLYLKEKNQWTSLVSLLGIANPETPSHLVPDSTQQKFFQTDGALSWNGLYRFEDLWRKPGAKHPGTRAYMLRIFDRDSTPTGRLDLDAAGQAQRMSLRVELRGDSLAVYLGGYLRGNYGRSYKSNAHLFSLVRNPGGDIRTLWAEMKPFQENKSVSESELKGFTRLSKNPNKNHE